MSTRMSCRASPTTPLRSSTGSSETSLPAKLLSKLLSTSPVTAVRPPPTGGLRIWSRVVPPRGFEPLISALKGRRPRPLDDGGECDRDSVRQKERAKRVVPLALSGSGSWIRTNDLRVMSPTSYHCSIPRRFVVSYSRLDRRESRAALAPADCPTQLPAQYRWRWGVSRPCSGRERVGPPRVSHQGHALTREHQASQPRASSSPGFWAPDR